ncbi:uncharacterized protein LOC110740324 [Chenopodium quinoa]|uniref:uncharacterized protein LOC110740324 n=1 Tax=Chenopodium quinoa TaxID=63459 RepID=UPI000B77C422|nr:uncharacterized protein LOC110740324 [Chenopodium quinoa]XP_021776502.1 uncharacterized protein LOC110740324 [Chenopodium quinoa]XP_021776503.1 uncharacterized protein LOC110740324 [Chenopodium quinoa]
MNNIGVAIKRDRFASGGDYGKLGSLDVTYGENHPKDARDSNGPLSMAEGFVHEFVQHHGYDYNTRRRKRGDPKNSIPNQVKRKKHRSRSSSEAGLVASESSNSNTHVPCAEEPHLCHVISARDVYSLNWTISLDLVCLLTRLVTWFHNVCMGIREGCTLVRMPLSAQTEELFCGGGNGFQLLLHSLNTFFQSPYSQYLAIVAQLHDGDVGRSCTWLVAKSGTLTKNGEPTELCVLQADYPSLSLHVIKSLGGASKEFIAAIYEEWFKQLPCKFLVLAK